MASPWPIGVVCVVWLLCGCDQSSQVEAKGAVTAAPTVSQSAQSSVLASGMGCQMYASDPALGDTWSLKGPLIDECTWYDLSLKNRPGPKKGKLGYCLPDTAGQEVDGVGDPRNYHAHRKVRFGAVVLEIGLWSSGDAIASGVLQLDRVAPRIAVETVLLRNFHMSTSELNEVVHALAKAELRHVSTVGLSDLQRRAFSLRCADWNEPARGAVDLDIWRGLALTFPIKNPRPLPSGLMADPEEAGVSEIHSYRDAGP